MDALQEPLQSIRVVDFFEKCPDTFPASCGLVEFCCLGWRSSEMSGNFLVPWHVVPQWVDRDERKHAKFNPTPATKKDKW